MSGKKIVSRKTPKIREENPLLWIFEPFMAREDFARRRMFGHDALYLRGRLQLLVGASGEEPWNGMLVATSREHHDGIRGSAPSLEPHSVLGKWLYISQSHAEFETTVSQVQALLRRNDERIGVESGAKKKRATQSRRKGRWKATKSSRPPTAAKESGWRTTNFPI